MLHGFRDKDFFEQIGILDRVATDKDPGILPDLLDLYLEPVGDTSVDKLVLNALNQVLSVSENEVVKGLTSKHEKFQALCIRMAGERRFRECSPVLTGMLAGESDPDRRFDILAALSKIGDESSKAVLLEHARSDDPYVAAMCIESLAGMGGSKVVEILSGIIDANENDQSFEECDIATWKAIDALAAMDGEEAVKALAAKLHHRNPTARRIISDALVALGEAALPHLGDAFRHGDTDQRILAANVFGFIGHKSGADFLVHEVDLGKVAEPNVKYALYEALGRIGTMKGIICLMDALENEDELILMAVVGGLNRHVNPGMVADLAERLGRDDGHAALLVKAVIAAGAVNLFAPLYENEAVAAKLLAVIAETKDPEILALFRDKLASMGTDQARMGLARLPETTEALSGRVLAVDDSKSMLALYRSIITSMGLEPVVAANGQEALEAVAEAGDFDLVITDMNMPVMDGVELVGKLREMEGSADLPVVMVTTESESSQRDLAEKVGVDTFLSKPFKPDDLIQMVKGMLAR